MNKTPQEGGWTPIPIYQPPVLTPIEKKQRSLSTFERAIFLKPRPTQIESKIQMLAPLIAIRLPERLDKPTSSYLPRSAKSADLTSTQPQRKQETPTVFFLEDVDNLGAETRPRITFLWYSLDKIEFTSTSGVYLHVPSSFIAISLTLGRSGTPLIVRVLTSEESGVMFFVTDSVEAEAKRQFGPSRTAGAHSLDPPFFEIPGTSPIPTDRRVAVFMPLATPPEPSGPWVYVDGESFLVTTVLCRCSPSQIKSIVETHEYDLLPIAKVPKSITVPYLSYPTSEYLRMPNAIP